MKIRPWLLLCCLTVPVNVLGAPSDDHRDLSQAAHWAACRENIDLLKALLQAGVQINEPIEINRSNETGRTLLHLAAIQNQPHVIRFLRDNGASVHVRDKARDRPIDIAFRSDYTNACQALEIPETEETMVGDIPEAVIKEVIRLTPRDEITFVTFNGADAPKELTVWFQKMGWSKLRPGSDSELSEPTEGQEGQIRDRKSKEAGLLLKIAIKKTKAGYDWGVVLYDGPSGVNIQSGGLSKRYGYWIRVNVKGFES